MGRVLWLAVIFAAVVFESGAQETVHLKFMEEIASLRPSQLTAVVAEPDLKVRKQPNLQAEILLGLKKGESVTLNYRTFAEQDIAGKRSYWFYVTTKAGRRGWTFGHFLDFAKSQAETVPIVYDAELFVRPRGKAKTIDPDRKPLPLFSGRGLVIKDTAVFKDGEGRVATGYLPALAEIEYFPFFLTDLNPKGLVHIKVKATGAEGFIDLKSGIDLPVALGMPDVEYGDLIPAFLRPDKAAATKEFVSFSGPSPNKAMDLSHDTTGALWLKVNAGGDEINYWIPAEHQRFDWDNTIVERILYHLIDKRPPETAQEAIAAFGQPAGWYIQKVEILSSPKHAWMHHLFFNGLYLLLIEPEDKEQKWWLAEFYLWDRIFRMNYGLELELPRSLIENILTNPNEVVINSPLANMSGAGWMRLHYSDGKKLQAVYFANNIELHWYYKAVFMDGFHGYRLPLFYGYLDEEKTRSIEVHFCE